MSSLPDYRDDPVAYELEERSRPDEMIMLQTAGDMAVTCLDQRQEATTLDLCCGTGLSMERLIGHPNASLTVGVDISLPYLAFARAKYAQHPRPPQLIHGDAVSVPLPRDSWDIVILASAYHHIEDARKITFLRRVRGLLGLHGRAILAENVLPHYQPGDLRDYARAIRDFYDEVLVTAKQQNPDLNEHVAALIRRVAQYGLDGDYEYKVSMPILLSHLDQAGLTIEEQVRVWPETSSLLSGTGGNYVMLLRTA